jgi:hypothetical protein
MKEYYTYAYLREDGTPYYIGKGSGNRINDYHTKFVRVPPKERRLLLKQNLTETEAFRHEVYMIAVLGRKNLGTGILINRSAGGDNPPICVSVSLETRKKISLARKGKSLNYDVWNKGKKLPENLKLRISQTKTGSTHSEETKIKMSKNRKNWYWWNDGKVEKRGKECPGDSWTRGRLKL